MQPPGKVGRNLGAKLRVDGLVLDVQVREGQQNQRGFGRGGGDRKHPLILQVLYLDGVAPSLKRPTADSADSVLDQCAKNNCPPHVNEELMPRLALPNCECPAQEKFENPVFSGPHRSQRRECDPSIRMSLLQSTV